MMNAAPSASREGRRRASGDIDGTRLARAIELIDQRGAAAQLQVWRGDELLLDHATGCRDDDLFWIFSASKPFMAVLTWQLIERGELDPDSAVAAHWPEFGAHGKHRITVRHVLQHRTGLPVATSRPADILAMTDWHKSIRRIEDAKPRWPAGSQPAYQYIVYGFILGELIARVTGLPLRRVLQERLLDPLGLTDTRLGVRLVELGRTVPIHATGRAAALVEHVVNASATRRAVIPAAGISTTAADLARFYRMMLGGGTLEGVRVLKQATVDRMLVPSSLDERDRFARSHIQWSQGFQLGGPRANPGEVNPLGTRSSPRAFGHNGSNCCIGWADPDRGLAFAYLTDRLVPGRGAIPHLAAVGDAVLAAVRPG